MKRVATLALLAFIILNFVFIILRLAANGSEDNFFNQNYRSKFAKNELLRGILGMHYDGDGKSDYLGSKYSKILIEVDSMQGLVVPQSSLQLLAEKISAATGKEVSYVISDKNIPYSDSVDIKQVDQITKQYRNFKNQGDTAGIYLLYLSTDAGQPDQVGSTYQEYGILLFSKILVDFTANNPATFNNYIESTALHEFGHQLGLPHNNFSDCLMQTYVDAGFSGFTSPDGIIVDFCNYERQQIAKNAK